MRGSLREVPFTDVLQLMDMGKKTGRLSVTNGKDFLELFFKEGNIIYGSMLNRREMVGEILFSRGIITQDILREAETKVETGHLSLGASLIELGISEDVIKKTKEEEIQQIVSEAFLWKDGFFNFNQEELPKARPLISIKPLSILLEGTKHIDELEKVEHSIVPLDTILIQVEDEETREFEKEEKTVLSYVDGKRTVKEVLEQSGIPLLDASRVLHRLLVAGVVETLAKKPESEVKPERERVVEHINLGTAFLKTGLFEEAKREFRRILEVNPRSKEGFFYLGVLEIHRGNWDEAITLLQKALHLDNRNHKILVNLGFAYMQKKEYESARENFLKALNLNPEEPKAKVNLGLIYIETGNNEDAKNILKEVVKTNPQMKLPFLYLGKLYIKEGKYIQAADVLNVVLRNNLESSSAYLLLGYSYKLSKKYSEAENVLKKGLAHSDDPLFHLLLGEVFYEKGAYDAAIKEYLMVVRRDGSNFLAFFRLGNLFYNRGDFEKAAQNWEKALKISPEDPICKRNLNLLKNIGAGG